jgi:hypothetical protein
VIVNLRSQLILPIFQSIPERLQHLFEDVDGCEFFQESDNFECGVSVGLILGALVLLGDDAADWLDYAEVVGGAELEELLGVFRL